MVLLLGGLFAANVVYYEAYTFANIVKPLGIIFLGWILYLAIFRQVVLKLPRVLEEFEHLVGVMGLSLVALFWMAMA